ncbi:MAG: lipopolysaccharide heptosyltransferase II [Candidatus Omnitrophica bacterium]|nr:lipopolysaccharide heptosyltransferase II [Candidatus Omnitrophota bacterium]
MKQKEYTLDQSSVEKILIINIFGIGDVLFTTPLIDNLRAAFPLAEIHYLGNARTKIIFKNHPLITKCFSYDRDDFLKLSKSSKLRYWKQVIGFIKQIKAEKYDVVFDFSLNSFFNYMTWLAGIPNRIGFNYKNRSPLLTFKVPFYGFERKHVVEHYLDLLKNLGIGTPHRSLNFPLTEEDRLWARQFLSRENIDQALPIVGIIPGAGASWGKEARYRRWKSEKYVKLVDKLIEKYRAQIILMGDQSESELCSQIMENAQGRIIPAYGKTTIRQLAALLQRCSFVILNDGGPLHIAVAAGTKTVSIFGPVDPDVYGPFGSSSQHAVVKKNLPCQPCYRRFRMTNCDHVSCLKNITVEDVLSEIQTISV